MDNSMISVRPFMATIDIAPEHEAQPQFREAQIVGIADQPGGLKWIAIETIDGWEYPRLVHAVKWADNSVRT